MKGGTADQVEVGGGDHSRSYRNRRNSRDPGILEAGTRHSGETGNSPEERSNPRTGEAAAIRETAEEIGLRIEVHGLIGESTDVDHSLSAEQHVRIRAYLASPADPDWRPADEHIRWIRMSDLDRHRWPRANAEINRLIVARFPPSDRT